MIRVTYDWHEWKNMREYKRQTSRDRISSWSLAIGKHPHIAHFINFPYGDLHVLLSQHITYLPFIQTLGLDYDPHSDLGKKAILELFNTLAGCQFTTIP